MSTEGRVLVDIEREECIRLLQTRPVGRFAIAPPDQAPLVVPVNYIVDGDFVVFRSDYGAKVRLLDASPVSFEVDDIDWFHRSGWSVLVRGVAYEATHWEVAHLLLEPWADGDKRHWIRVKLTEVTGRRLDNITSDFATDDTGYL